MFRMLYQPKDDSGLSQYAPLEGIEPSLHGPKPRGLSVSLQGHPLILSLNQL